MKKKKKGFVAKKKIVNAIYSIPSLNNLYDGYILNLIFTYNLKFWKVLQQRHLLTFYSTERCIVRIADGGAYASHKRLNQSIGRKSQN